MGLCTKLLFVGGLLASVACSATLVGADSADVPDASAGSDSGGDVSTDGSVTPSDDSGASSSGGVTGCAAMTVFPEAIYEFGAVRVGTTATGRLVLRNVGAATIPVIAAGLSAPFTFVSPSSFAVAPGASANFDLAFSPTTDTSAASKVVLTWPDCTTEVKLRGFGSTEEVIVNPGTLNLGSAPCGGSVPSGQVAINSTISTTYTAQIASPFTTAAGPLTASNTAPTLHAVGMEAFGPNDPPRSFEGLLQLAFAVGGTKAVKVLAQSVGGVVNVNNVTLAPTGIAVFRNTGNESVSVKLLEPGLSFSPNTFDLAPGAMRNVTVSRVNQSEDMFQVSVSLTAGKNCGGTTIFLVSVNK